MVNSGARGRDWVRFAFLGRGRAVGPKIGFVSHFLGVGLVRLGSFRIFWLLGRQIGFVWGESRSQNPEFPSAELPSTELGTGGTGRRGWAGFGARSI